MRVQTFLMILVLLLSTVLVAAAQDRPTPSVDQSSDGSLAAADNAANAASNLDGKNIYKYEGAPANFNTPLDIHGKPMAAMLQPNGKYTMALYADPENGAIYCGNQDGGMMTEAMTRMKMYAPSKGYTYKYFLGNMYGRQRKDMPLGVIDQAHKRVIFTDVELKHLSQPWRLNLVVKIYGPDHKELKAPDPNGFYGWLTDEPDKSVIHTKDNGILFDIDPDGSIQAMGRDEANPS